MTRGKGVGWGARGRAGHYGAKIWDSWGHCSWCISSWLEAACSGFGTASPILWCCFLGKWLFPAVFVGWPRSLPDLPFLLAIHSHAGNLGGGRDDNPCFTHWETEAKPPMARGSSSGKQGQMGTRKARGLGRCCALKSTRSFRTWAALPPTVISESFPPPGREEQRSMPSKAWCRSPPAGDGRTCTDQPAQASLPQDVGSRFPVRFLVARAVDINSKSPRPEELGLSVLGNFPPHPEVKRSDVWSAMYTGLSSDGCRKGQERGV